MGWYYIYYVNYFNEFTEKMVSESGIVFSESGKMVEAFEKIAEYYGDKSIENVSIKAGSEGPCLVKQECENIDWRVEHFDA